MKQSIHVCFNRKRRFPKRCQEMDTEEENRIKITILRKMVRQGFIGGKHTSIENLPKGLPRSQYDRAKKVIKRMDKYFIVKSKPDSTHVSIDPKMLLEIYDLIKNENDS